MKASEQVLVAGTALNELIVKMQTEMAAYLIPTSGITEHDVLNTLIGLLDGPEQRAAQALWEDANTRLALWSGE